MQTTIHSKWNDFIQSELKQEYMQALIKKVSERRKEINIYPPPSDIWNAFKYCDYDNLKVIILGQDPYHTPGMAHGLAFSTNNGKRPPSLDNIFKEIHSDIFNNNTGGVDVFQSNNLSQWAWQGVLLINTVLTVEEGKAGSHKDYGWKTFTLELIKMINKHPHKLVFMLWGKEAKEYRSLIDSEKHLVLEAEHPASALYKEGSWFGNRHFSKANAFIHKHYFNIKRPINWGTFNNTTHI